MASSALPMLGPAVNRQPGFRRGLVEQSNAARNNPAVGWLAECLLLQAAEAAVCSQAAADGCIFVWPTGLLTGWFLPGYLPVRLALAGPGWLWLWLAVASVGWLSLVG